ncbi:MAG: PP2C family protein-serine/threonine phosphatase [Terriglobia bacterium]|jgi:serine phosphatase RsbU (regulator of sigma subunit)|nr:PP2C family protein-serine/threonine phosphatase [Terriglobia bacterium]
MKGATEVHRALCAPELQHLGAFEFASTIIPARHVSGDFVHSLQHRGKTFIVLGDLMGKGLSAAMWLTHVIDLVHRAAEGSQNVCDLLSRLNSEILESRVRAPLMSAVALCFEEGSSVVSCALAGHPPAVIIRGDVNFEIATAGGPLLGVFSSPRYECQDVDLRRGESIVAFSDGLIERRDHREDFSIGWVAALAAKAADAAPLLTISTLLDASTDLTRENRLDDTSIMVLRRSK